MMNDIELERKFSRMFASKELDDLQDISIFETSKDNYVVFKNYNVIKKSKTDVDVRLINGDLVHSFSSMRNAICWCIFDKRGKYVLASRIITLDRGISNEEVQINVHNLPQSDRQYFLPYQVHKNTLQRLAQQKR